MNPPVVQARLLHLDAFSARCGLHPDLVRRFVVLGLVEAESRRDETMWFAVTQVRRVERMRRLRSDLGLSYNALGLVLDLLERIEELERSAATR